MANQAVAVVWAKKRVGQAFDSTSRRFARQGHLEHCALVGPGCADSTALAVAMAGTDDAGHQSQGDDYSTATSRLPCGPRR